MRDLRFFEGVPQRTVGGEGREVPIPTFYYGFSQLVVVLATPLERIGELLPAPWLHPCRLTPLSGVTVIAAFQYRDSDIGPYNEVLVGFPVGVHRREPMLRGLRRFNLRGGAIFIWQLPVTSALVRDLGVEMAGYPKFLADIDFEADGRTAACQLREGGKDILGVRMEHRAPRPVAARRRVEPITVKGDRVLRSHAVMGIPEAAQAYGGRGVEVELGDHPLADRIRELRLGRVLLAGYEPRTQSILTPPVESWPLGSG